MTAARIQVLSTSPEPQPAVTLEEVKAHLKVTIDAEDELLKIYIDAAIKWCEEEANRAITPRQYRISLDRFPNFVWVLPLGKIQSIDSIQYIDVDGAQQTWSASPQEYEADLETDFRPRLRPRPGFTWPTTGSYFSAAVVNVTAGWTAAQMPYTVRQAILLKVADFSEQRAPGDPTSAAIDAAAKTLLDAYRLAAWA